ncbi:MAG: YHS domain-containing protein [Acidimicrobiaceae bacterium]|nr:YHS domain-containing protein [Acidimicrobiaceae bacterium]MYJ41498.1 YHS domain-containing protein [Acidimicrobiaceae bacterium]
MDVAVLAEAVELTDQRVPYVLATVVWRRGPSSGRQGSKAVVLADGTVRGWLGGACAEPSVVRHARQCLETGEPALLFLGQPDELDGRSQEGVRSVAMACESEGALEVYLEPHRPEPQMVVVGRSPAVDALAEMAVALGWGATIVDDGGEPGEHARPEIVRTKLDLSALGIDGATAVVVATQGHYDDLALEAALAHDPGYIGLIASQKRAAAVIDHLADRGVARSETDRVHAPAGLDLGAVANAEIAVAVMADLVARRARGELVAAGTGPAPARAEATDPVCGMTVLVDDAKYHTVHDGADYWFCAPGCKRAFEADPAPYVNSG